MNHDRNYARMGEVKAWVDEAFAIADEYMTTDRPESDFPSHFTFIPYDRAAVDAKVEGIYRTLWNHKYGPSSRRASLCPTTAAEGHACPHFLAQPLALHG